MGRFEAPGEGDFKASEWVDFEALERVWFSGPSVGRWALICKQEVDLMAPEGGPFEASGRSILGPRSGSILRPLDESILRHRGRAGL